MNCQPFFPNFYKLFQFVSIREKGAISTKVFHRNTLRSIDCIDHRPLTSLFYTTEAVCTNELHDPLQTVSVPIHKVGKLTDGWTCGTRRECTSLFVACLFNFGVMSSWRECFYQSSTKSSELPLPSRSTTPQALEFKNSFSSASTRCKSNEDVHESNHLRGN